MFKNTRDFVLKGQWMADTATMENSKETFWLWVKQAAKKQHLSENLQKKMFGDLKEITKGLQKYCFLHKEKKTFLLVFKERWI